jgi:hypothetical protein
MHIIKEVYYILVELFIYRAFYFNLYSSEPGILTVETDIPVFFYPITANLVILDYTQLFV